MEGDNLRLLLGHSNTVISTHALTWRTTTALSVDFVDLAISTHALHMEGDVYAVLLSSLAVVNFYPRLRMEGDFMLRDGS